jgi:hypothetical protein
MSRRVVLRGLASGAAASVAAFHGLGCGSRQEPAVGLPDATGDARRVEDPPGEVFASVEIEGSHREIGRAMGEQLGAQIRAVLQSEPSFERCLETARGPARELVEAFLAAARAHLPNIVEEVEGLAEGLDMPFDDLFAWHCRSELSAAAEPCPPGCSTVGLKRSEQMILAHNEDGSAAYLDRMLILRARPPSGIAFAALVYPGTIAGNAPGLNARGVAQTTNYISPCEVPPGIPRYLIGRAVFEAESLEQAVGLATMEGRAFPWHHNLASLTEGRLISLETWPGRHHALEVEGTFLHTNHLLHPEMTDLPERRDYLDRSSLPRLRSLERSTEARPPETREDLLAALTDHSGRPCRVCRHRDDEVPGVTVATAIFESPRPEMTLIAGPPCSSPSITVTCGFEQG